MLAALAKAFAQLSDPPVRRVVLRGLVGAALVFFGLVGAAWFALVRTEFFGILWLDRIVEILGGAAALVVALLLYPVTVVVILSFFLDDVAAAVEARHYPDLPPARNLPFVTGAWAASKLALLGAALNLLVLPLYFFPVLFPFIFFGLNGYLLGREYFELVALRRLEATAARRLRRRRRAGVFAAGVVIAILLSIPVLGWAMPVVAAAFMVHVFHAARRGDAARPAHHTVAQ